jgi:hypothetical protein
VVLLYESGLKKSKEKIHNSAYNINIHPERQKENLFIRSIPKRTSIGFGADPLYKKKEKGIKLSIYFYIVYNVHSKLPCFHFQITTEHGKQKSQKLCNILPVFNIFLVFNMSTEKADKADTEVTDRKKPVAYK